MGCQIIVQERMVQDVLEMSLGKSSASEYSHRFIESLQLSQFPPHPPTPTALLDIQ